jgi:hypothetical protein
VPDEHAEAVTEVTGAGGVRVERALRDRAEVTLMSEPDLTPDEITLVRAYIHIPPGLAMDRMDVQRARTAQAVGGWFRKVGPGLYRIVTEEPRPGT